MAVRSSSGSFIRISIGMPSFPGPCFWQGSGLIPTIWTCLLAALICRALHLEEKGQAELSSMHCSGHFIWIEVQLLSWVLSVHLVWHVEPIPTVMHWPSQVLKVILTIGFGSPGSEQISPCSSRAVIFSQTRCL